MKDQEKGSHLNHLYLLISGGFHEILRHSLPTALHESKEFFLSLFDL